MFSPWQLGLRYLKYFATAQNGKGHGIHSPFVYDLVTEVLNNTQTYYCYGPIEAQRMALLQNHALLQVEDFGAGSRTGAKKERSVASIARTALKPRKYGQLLFRMVNHYRPQVIVELGTCLGITTAYLASAHTGAHVYTLEGATQVAQVAGLQWKELNLQNIQCITGPFEQTLQPLLDTLHQVDFAYLDGNHRLAPTLAYFEALLPKCHAASILVMDDIHWSAEMEQAWQQVKQHPAVTLTVDLFYLGLVFFNDDIKVKQDFVIRF